MKRLYARLVLWLILPAVDAAIADSVKPGGQLWRIKNRGSNALSPWHVVRAVSTTGELHYNAGLHLSETGQPIPSGDMTAGSR